MKRIGAYRNGEYLGRIEPVPQDADLIVGRHFGKKSSRWMTDDEYAKMAVATVGWFEALCARVRRAAHQ